MANVKVNGKVVSGDLAKLLSQLTRTKTVGETVIDSAALLGIEVNGLEATCPNLDAMRVMTDGESLVEITDEGKHPNPRIVTWQNLIKIVESAIAAYPYSLKVEEITKPANGLVTFLDTGKENASKAGFDFSARF